MQKELKCKYLQWLRTSTEFWPTCPPLKETITFHIKKNTENAATQACFSSCPFLDNIRDAVRETTYFQGKKQQGENKAWGVLK